jgi:putative ABC transport system permease protein
MIGQDVRHAARAVAQRPGASAVAILTLALGIGANTAVFSVVDSVRLRPLPVGDPDRLAMLWEHKLTSGNTHNVVNAANHVAWRQRNRSFDSITAFSYYGINLTGAGDSARILTASVTGNYFSSRTDPARALRAE